MRCSWMYLSVVVLVVNCVLVSSKIHRISWSLENFSQSKDKKILFTKPGDKLVISCPDGVESPIYESMWPVNFRGYESCDASCEDYTRVMICGTPGGKKTTTLHVINEGISRELLGNFIRGSMHYFIAPSQGTNASLEQREGGHCHTYNMKLAVYVCDLPQDQACDVCSLPLGLEDGRLGHNQVTSSEKKSEEQHKATYARLLSSTKCPSHVSSWCVEPSRDKHYYIQFDLRFVHLLSAVATQGSPHSPRWVTRYHLMYSFDGKNWFTYRIDNKVKMFVGNTDQYTIVRHWFKPRFHARYVRIQPGAWNLAICLRVELYGCAVERVDVTYKRQSLISLPKDGVKDMDDKHTLCGSQRCPPYASCKVSDGKVECSCAMECSTGKRVCGTDGFTYGNLCRLKQAACKGNKLIKVAKTAVICAGKVHSSESSVQDSQLRLIGTLLIAVSSLGIVTFIVIVWGWNRDTRSYKRSHYRQLEPLQEEGGSTPSCSIYKE